MESGHTEEFLYGEKNNGAIGVPLTYMDKHNPEQFEIIGFSLLIAKPIKECIPDNHTYQKGGSAFYLPEGEKHHKRLYGRIVIRRKEGKL